MIVPSPLMKYSIVCAQVSSKAKAISFVLQSGKMLKVSFKILKISVGAFETALPAPLSSGSLSISLYHKY